MRTFCPPVFAKRMRPLSKGFTLIELLIVIAVIAILAVAILSAINPVEQLRKANDSRRRSDTAELLNTLERYYTTLQAYPWGGTAPNGRCPFLSGQTGSPACLSTGWSVNVDALVTKGELKSEFAGRDLGEYYITEETTGTSQGKVHVCFSPESTTWKDASVAKFTRYGAAGTGYVCVPE